MWLGFRPFSDQSLGARADPCLWHYSLLPHIILAPGALGKHPWKEEKEERKQKRAGKTMMG